MNRTELIIWLVSIYAVITTAILFAVRRIVMRGIFANSRKTRREKEISHAAESLEQMAYDMEQWIQEQREQFKRATTAFRKKWISRWFSDFSVMELFRDKAHKKRFDNIVETFRTYIPDMVEPLKEIKNNFLRSAKFMKQIEQHKNSVESVRDLGFWCVNFLDTTVTPTIKCLRKASEQTREHLPIQKPENLSEKRVFSRTL